MNDDDFPITTPGFWRVATRAARVASIAFAAVAVVSAVPVLAALVSVVRGDPGAGRGLAASAADAAWTAAFLAPLGILARRWAVRVSGYAERAAR